MASGLTLSGGAAILLEYLDDSLKTADDVRYALGLKVLGSIAKIQDDEYTDKLVVAKYPRSPLSEAYRVLRTNLQYSAGRPLRTLIVTSSSPLEGKSVTASNLAMALAQSGQRVILVDADIRRPTQQDIFELDNDVGLSNFLECRDMRLADVLQTVSGSDLNVVTSGPAPDNPSELLGSRRMGDLVESLLEYADVAVFDSPPVMAVADAAILASRLDGVLLVVNAGTTRRGAARQSKESLEAVGAHLLGVVLNRLSSSQGGYYYYYSGEDRRRKRRSLSNILARFFGRDGRSAPAASASLIAPEETASARDEVPAQLDYPRE
jgi:non-specific protein-tyrosine kinase